MAFCPKCKSLVYPVQGQLTCKKCGWSGGAAKKRTITTAMEEKEVLVLDDADIKRLETMPTMRSECPECGHMEAFFRTQQTRKSDEPETTFLRCMKCGHRWRKY